jgi:hypothetical protein
MFLLLLSLLPLEPVKTEHAPRIEINTKYDDDGRACYRQIIVWDYDDANCWRIRGWRMLRGGDSRTVSSVIFLDGETMRKITADHIFVSDTFDDPELEERKINPHRRDLGR